MKAENLYLALAEAIANSPEIPPCQVSDPEVWFAEKGDWAATNQAKKLCQSCPVINECLAYAMQAKEIYGVWGGLSGKERQNIRGKKLANLGYSLKK